MASAKVAVVTGSNSGVGRALSVMLAADGFVVYATMRSPSKAEELLANAKEAGVEERIVVVQCDVSNDESVQECFAKVLADHGRIDILVNNAGYCVFGSIEFLSMEAVKAQFETNVFGVIRCTKAALPAMRAQKSGKLINVTSVGGIWGQPFNDVYCSSKFAIEGLAESHAALYRTFGVYTTNVEPGGISTKFAANVDRPDPANVPPEYLPHLQSTIHAYTSNTGRAQTPEQVAAAIMEQVVRVEKPPLRCQTNKLIQAVFEMQLADPSGEAGVAAGDARFLAHPDAAATEAKEGPSDAGVAE